ncbi:MAG: serine/threonine protein kinase, partial [Polyangiales bacterium]
HPEVARDAVAVERFKREYEISKDLPHEHIVEVLDFQTLADNRYALSMEFLDGEELREILKREKTVEPARLLRIVCQVAIGLGEAHRREFVHRDLKPDNIFCCGARDGDIAKLLDFGSVRINKNRQMSKLTSMGTTIGSPYYMSPEQAQGAENLDHRADIFALGAITYECLTGTVPFTGNNGPAILLSILTKTPAPVTTKAKAEFKLPPALDDVIDDALAKKPDTRTSSVGAFADAFGKAFGLEGSHKDWAYLSIGEIEHRIEAARSSGAAGAEAVEDPFASGAGDVVVEVAAPSPPAAAKPTAAAKESMDAAFAKAAKVEGPVSMPPSMPPTNGASATWMIVAAVLAIAGVVGYFVMR